MLESFANFNEAFVIDEVVFFPDNSNGAWMQCW